MPDDQVPGAQPGSAQGSAPSSVPAAPAAQPVEFSQIIPEDFKDKSWVKETKDIPALFKRMDDNISLLGQRAAGIPEDTASEDEWKKFNTAFGVPEKPDQYEFGKPPEGMEINPDFQSAMQQVFHKAGVSKRQSKILETGYNEVLTKLVGDKVKSAEQMDADFDKLATDTFGEKKEGVLRDSKALLAEFTPDNMKPHLESISNEGLVLMAGVLNGIREKFIKPDQIPAGGTQVGPMTDEQKRARGRELMASKAYTDAFHPEHDKVVKEVQELYGTG